MSHSGDSLIPARMINEWSYCPRLAALEWLHGEWADNQFTTDGRRQHRRVDRPEGGPKGAPKDQDPDDSAGWKARSVWLDAPQVGITAKMDLVESEGGVVSPVDTKRGRAPNIPEGAYEPERVQLCAQALVLREHDYKCERGYLWFVGSRRRVEVLFDVALIARTLEIVRALRAQVTAERLPPPLEDSPRCDGCSLVDICLPDEVNALNQATATTSAVPAQSNQEDAAEAPPAAAHRALLTPTVERQPLYVVESRAKVGVSQGLLVVRMQGKALGSMPLGDISHVAIFGRAQVSTQAIRACLDGHVPICWFTYGGYFLGMTQGQWHKNAQLRRAQWRLCDDVQGRALVAARGMVRGKIRNQRTLLRRNGGSQNKDALRQLKVMADRAKTADSVETLLGMEGAAASAYFGAFRSMLRDVGPEWGFDATGRNRRPPLDPINALLSFGYAILTRELATTVSAAGFDPLAGVYHTTRYGRPSLALDLMEEFRAVIVDSVVLSVINRGEVRIEHFTQRLGHCNLNKEGRRRFLKAYERRLAELVTHPTFGYRMSWRRIISLQARLFARFTLGEISEYAAMETR